MYKCNVMCLFGVVIIFCLFYLVDNFNIETINYARHNGSYKSMFGFSVATHREQGQSWVLVGAPEEQDNYSGIRKGGVVYKCNIHYEGPCEQIRFHQNTSEQARTLDDKENQWFGATVSTAGPDGPVVACAPRYVWFTTSREERRDPVGTCYIAKDNFRTFSEYSPCRTSLFGYHRQGSCQAGFSAGISNDSRRLFIGAPGSWYWQGQSYSIDPSIKYPYTPGIFGEAFGFGAKAKGKQGQVIQKSLDARPAVVSTPESPATYDNSYMGYSMVLGDFNGAGVQGAAVGMPKGGKKLEGKVLLYTWDLTNYLNITGRQLGEYFGYSVAASDIDGDHRTDLIIGAPLHAEKNSEMKYEVGRVYIVYQGKQGGFSRESILDGFNSKSRFGLSMSGLGDLNLDGYGDFAVGAPYDGPNEQGAVYIFQGSAHGVIKQYSQVIYAEDIQKSFSTFQYVDTFGFSISGGFDLDENDYPDMAVGAYLSDASYFFRARPVIKVQAKLTFMANPKQIFLENPRCTKPGDIFTRVPCIDIQLCMHYTGRGTPEVMDFNLTYTLDTQKQSHSRMYFEDNRSKMVNTSIILRKNQPPNCQIRTVYLESQLADKLTELEIRLEYFLNQNRYYQEPTRDPNSILQAVLDTTYPTFVNDSISIYKNCGDDNKCTPSLYLAIKKKFDKYVFQVGKPLEFDVKVINSEENSYGTKFYINLPQDLTFTVAYKAEDEKNILISNKLNKTLYSISLDDPLTKENPIHFILKVEPLGKHKMLKPRYDFYMNVTSANPGRIEDLVNQTHHISVDVWVKAILNIDVQSTPKTIYHNISHGKSQESIDNELHPLVTHSYTVTNTGPSDVEEVEIYIVWPEETLSGQDLLYLLEQPHTLGGVTCEPVEVNAYNLPVSHLKDVWDGLIENKQDYLGNSTQGHFTENGTGRPGEFGDTITKTLTQVTFYDNNKAVVYQKNLIGEPEWNDYWGNISAIASDFIDSLTIKTNQTTLIEKYVDQEKISETIITRPDDAVNEYRVTSNSSTIVRYLGPVENFIFEEIVTAQPGSPEFKSHIQKTKDGLAGVMSVVTTTTKHIRIENMDGTLVHHEILTLTGTEKRTNPVISRTNIITNVLYTDKNGKLLYKDSFTVQPTSNTYWSEINKFISRFKEPVTIKTYTAKVVTYFNNSVEVRREEIPIDQVVETSVTSNTKVNTVITITYINKTLAVPPLTIPSEDYNNYLNNIIQSYKEPVNVNVKTTYLITYSRKDGRVARYETYIKERTELVLPTQLETKSTSTITTVTIYDVSNKILYQENVTESPNSKEYWEKLNKLISEYNQPVTITKKHQTIITYYINGKEVRKEPDASAHAHKTTLSTHADVKVSIEIFNSTGHSIYAENLNKPVQEDHVKALISRYTEFITVKIKTTTTIHYVDSNGRVVQTGVLIAQRTVTHVPRQEETTKIITTVTTVTILDVYNNVLYRVNITDAPDSVAYWEKINKIISSHQEPVTVEKVTQTIITYYVKGVPVRTETQGPPISSTALSTHIDVASLVTVYNSRGIVIHDKPISGEVTPNQINEIVNLFRESVTVNIKTTYIISYRSPDGNVVKTGTYVLQRTEKHDTNQNETQTTTTITTVIFKDLSGNIVLHENVTETPGSKEYWEKLTQLVSSFKKQVTIEVKTQTVITYYVDGHVVGTQLVDGSGVKESEFSTQSEVVSVITVTNANGVVLDTKTLLRVVKNDDIQDIIRRFTESITVNVQTTHQITYIKDGRIVKIATYVQKRTETHTRPTNETTSVASKTTIIFYDIHRNILHEVTIDDEPESPAYWKRINEIITQFRKTVTVLVTVEKIITYYVNGQPVRVEPMPVDTHSTTYTSRIDVTTVVEIYSTDGVKIYETNVNFEKGTSNYNEVVADLVRRYREPISVKTKSTYIIAYIDVNGRISHSESITKEETETHNYHQQETEHVSTVTVITFYDSRNNFVHQETVREEPGSRIYWDQIKVFIERFKIPASIHTNATKIISYTVNGREVRQEHRSDNKGNFAAPIMCETETLISYYDAQNKFLHTEHAQGDLNNQELQVHASAFGKNYKIASVQVHKTVTFRSSSGVVIHTFTIPVNHQLTIQVNPSIINPGNHQETTRTVTETTFVVYGTERDRPLYTETISGEPGSDSYNNVVARILRSYPAPFTIYTNSTKTTTYYSQGVPVNKQFENEAQSTIRQEGGSLPSSARTTITFYGPNGKPLHSDTINGAPGADLQEQLRKIAGEYGGAVRSYGGFANGGSIGGNVNFIDTPHAGGGPTLSPGQFDDFNARNFGSNHNSQQASEYDEGAYSSEEEDDFNHEGLGAFARGNGFRTGGLNLGNGGNADQQARNNFDAHRTYEQEHNYLSSRSGRRSTREIHSSKSKREDKTDEGIRTLSNCATSRCLLMKCTTGPIPRGHEVHIAIRARVFVQTLKNISMTQPVTIQSSLLARISKFLEFSAPPMDRKLYSVKTSTTVMAPQPDIKPDVVPLWVVVLSAVAGTLILLLLIFLLYMCGFFNRNRPSDAPERQPLNRNGHFHHGDEAL